MTTTVRCKDCIHSKLTVKGTVFSANDRLVYWCNKIQDEVQLYWTGCIMGNDGKEAKIKEAK